jgi:hypothetical protein
VRFIKNILGKTKSAPAPALCNITCLEINMSDEAMERMLADVCIKHQNNEPIGVNLGVNYGL